MTKTGMAWVRENWPIITAVCALLVVGTPADTKQNERMSTMDEKIGALDHRASEVEKIMPELRERLAKLEQNSADNRRTLVRIEGKLDAVHQ